MALRTWPAELLASLPGAGHTVVQAELADPAAVQRMVDAAAGQLGGLDVLVNNAANFVAHPITEVSYEQWQAAWQQTIGVNLTGSANVTWCAVQHMIAGGGGAIVNVSSRGAFRGEPGQPAYGASKAGLNALGQSLAIALAPHNITVSAVAPGFVETDMAAAHLQGERGRRDPRAEPVRPRGPARGDRRRGPVPGVAGGDLGDRLDPGPERRVLPAHLRVCWHADDDVLRCTPAAATPCTTSPGSASSSPGRRRRAGTGC